METIRVDEYLVGSDRDKRAKIIKFNNRIIEDGNLIKKIAGEFLGFLKEGNINYDPNSVYCMNFLDVSWISVLLFGEANTFNELHKVYHEKPFYFCSMREEVYNTLRSLGTNKHFKTDYKNESAFLNSL